MVYFDPIIILHEMIICFPHISSGTRYWSDYFHKFNYQVTHRNCREVNIDSYPF